MTFDNSAGHIIATVNLKNRVSNKSKQAGNIYIPPDVWGNLIPAGLPENIPLQLDFDKETKKLCIYRQI